MALMETFMESKMQNAITCRQLYIIQAIVSRQLCNCIIDFRQLYMQLQIIIYILPCIVVQCT